MHAPAKMRAHAILAIGVACTAGLLGVGCGRDDRPAVWDYVSPVIFQPSCATASCHSPATAAAGLDFSDPTRGYTSLTALWVWIVDPKGTPEQGCRTIDRTIVCQRNHRPLVVPFDPSQSRLVNVLRARSAPRMPPDRALPEADIALVERWILNGAIGPDGYNDGHNDGSVNDGGVNDAAATDATATDAAVTDATATDAAVTDATATDATVTDATATDATATDATKDATDATVTDGSTSDATEVR